MIRFAAVLHQRLALRTVRTDLTDGAVRSDWTLNEVAPSRSSAAVVSQSKNHDEWSRTTSALTALAVLSFSQQLGGVRVKVPVSGSWACTLLISKNYSLFE